MALENVLVYRIATGDNTYPHSGNFTIVEAGKITIDDSDGSRDSEFGDFTHTGGADQPDQDVTASTVAGINTGDLVDLRYKYTFTGSDGSSGTVYFVATNAAANYGPLMVSDTPLDPSVTYTFGSFNTDGAVAYDDLIPCFTAGTLIKTDKGDKLIEALRPGDMIWTRDDGFQPLNWVGSRNVRAQGQFAPVRFQAGVMGNSRDLLVSPNHRMLIEGAQPELLFGEAEVFVAAKHLLGNEGVSLVEHGSVTYMHLLFDTHQVVMANDAPSESLFPRDQALNALQADAVAEIFALFPELEDGNSAGFDDPARLCLRQYEADVLTTLAA